MPESLDANLRSVRQTIARSAERAGHDPTQIVLVAVTKGFPVERIREAIAAGLRAFGENRVQEALPKIDEIGSAGVDWHLIGHLQTNKAKQARSIFGVFETVDRMELARALLKHSTAESGLCLGPVQALVQVRLGDDEGRSGVIPEDLPPVLDGLMGLEGLLLRGLMGVPPFSEDASEARRSFAFLRALWEKGREQLGAPSGQAVQDAVDVLEGSALFQGRERTVHTRIAGYDGKIYLDLCSPDWQVIEVSSSGYNVLRQSPVMFRRSRAMQALPLPVRDGSIEELRPFLNLAGDDAWQLVAGWLIAGFRPTGPYSVLTLYGEHGSAKSTTARVLRALIDPNDAPLRTTPRDARDLMITATNGHVVAFDNLSRIEPWLSDAICRLATGGGLSTRTLYTDAEEYIFEAQRPVLINGIDDLATRADLLDRSLVVSLPRIADENRRSEHDFWRDFEQTKPSILGALLAVVAAALHNLPETKLPELPRMADFALWVSAAEPAFAGKEGTFMAAYTGNRADANDTALEASPIVTPLRALLEHKDTWEGTPTELLAALEEHASEKVKEIAGDIESITGDPQVQSNLKGAVYDLSSAIAKANDMLGGFSDATAHGPAPAATAAPNPSGSAPRPRAGLRVFSTAPLLQTQIRETWSSNGLRAGPQSDINFVLLPGGRTHVTVGANDLGYNTSYNLTLDRRLSPKLQVSGGILYSNLGVRALLRPIAPLGIDARLYDARHPKFDLYGDVKLFKRLQLFYGQRNIFNAPNRFGPTTSSPAFGFEAQY